MRRFVTPVEPLGSVITPVYSHYRPPTAFDGSFFTAYKSTGSPLLRTSAPRVGEGSPVPSAKANTESGKKVA